MFQRLWLDSVSRPEWVDAKIKLLKDPGNSRKGIRAQQKEGGSVQFPQLKEVVVKNNVKASHEGEQVTVKSLIDSLKVCGNSKDLEAGKKLHNAAIQSGLHSNLYIASHLMHMYSKCGSMTEACKIFNSISHPNAVVWNTLMMGYISNKQHEEALDSFARMSCKPSPESFSAAFMACGGLAANEEAVLISGKLVKRRCLERLAKIHTRAKSAGDFIRRDVRVGTNLVYAYARCGSMVDARKVFDAMLVRDVVTWNVLMAGYADNGENEEALDVLSAMNCAPDARVFVTALRACGNGKGKLLERGISIHEQASRAGCLGPSNMYVWNSLISMYAKCGSMVRAQEVFDSMPNKDIISWNTIMQSYVDSGDSEQAWHLFTRLEKDGQCMPDGRSYMTALMACGNLMALEHGKQVHASILAKGLLEKDIVLVTSLINFYSKCGKMIGKNNEVGKTAVEAMVALNAKDSANFVLMVGIYAATRIWEERNKVLGRKISERTCELLGQNWWKKTTPVQKDKEKQVEPVQRFVGRDKRRRGKEHKVYYVPDLLSVQNEKFKTDLEKEEALCGHSEKLAVGCALINTQPGETIRIVNNLRLCDDCHTFTALVSKIEKREIVVRDASRLHIFTDGQCCCGDYW